MTVIGPVKPLSRRASTAPDGARAAADHDHVLFAAALPAPAHLNFGFRRPALIASLLPEI